MSFTAQPIVWPTLPPGAVISHVSAAQFHGLPLILPIGPPSITVPRGRSTLPAGLTVHWADLGASECESGLNGVLVTTSLRTVLDCGRVLPLYAAVAIMDWALRRRMVRRDELAEAVHRARGPGSGRLKNAFRWSDGRADSAQESVARVGLGRAGLPALPQYVLNAGPSTHPYDLGLPWCKCVIDLQSKEHHSAWPAVVRDINLLDEVNLMEGWKLIWSTPSMVLPDPDRFVRRVMATALRQPGPRSRRLRAKYVDSEGSLNWPGLASI